MSDSAHLDWRGAASRARTLVLPVAGASVSKVTEALTRGGWDPQTPVALISRAATTEQLTLTTSLGSLRAEARRNQSGDPVVLVVGEVVRLRSRLAWLERRPLFGRRIIVTRPRAQAARFAALLEAHGAEVVALPTIRLGPPEDWSPLDEAIARLGTFDWVMFTSANGVAAFHERLAHAERDARLLGRARLAAIGPETARALGAMGLRPDVVPAEYRAEGLAEALVPHVTRGSQVLLVRAAEAREALPEALRASGARVTIAPAYRTTAVKEGADFALAMLEARRVHVVTFTSSSTVRGFMGLIAPEERQRLLSGVVLAAIGPITAATLAEQGFEADVAPEEYTIPALTAAIAAHFEYRR